MVKGKEGLRTEMTHHGIAEVVQPVVVVGVAGQGVLGPVVVGVDLLPKEWKLVHPVHAEGQEVVIGYKTKHRLMKGCHVASRGVVAGSGIIETHIESELAEQS